MIKRNLILSLCILILIEMCTHQPAPAQLPPLPQPVHYYDVLTFNGYVVGLSSRGVDLFRLKDGKLTLLDHKNTSGEAQAGGILDSVFLISTTSGKLYKFKIENDRLYKIEEKDIDRIAQKIVISNNTAYLACVSSGISIIDLKSLKEKCLYKPASYSYPKSVYVEGLKVYIADFTMRLYMGRYRKGKIETIGSIPLSGVAHDVVVINGTAYVACSNKGIDVVSLHDKKVVQNIKLPGYALRIKKYSNYLLTTLADRGIAVLKIEGSRLKLIKVVDTPGNAYGIAISGNSAVVADYNQILIFDLTNLPYRINLMGMYRVSK